MYIVYVYDIACINAHLPDSAAIKPKVSSFLLRSGFFPGTPIFTKRATPQPNVVQAKIVYIQMYIYIYNIYIYIYIVCGCVCLLMSGMFTY